MARVRVTVFELVCGELPDDAVDFVRQLHREEDLMNEAFRLLDVDHQNCEACEGDILQDLTTVAIAGVDHGDAYVTFAWGSSALR